MWQGTMGLLRNNARKWVILAIAGTVVTGLAGRPAQADNAHVVLEDFYRVCEADADHPTTVKGFAQLGWNHAPEKLDRLYRQNIVAPDDAARLVRRLPEGNIMFAAAMTETTGLFGDRRRTLCFVRLFVDRPDDIREAFRSAMRIRPSKSVESDTVKSDLWARTLTGRVVGLRAVQLSEQTWMVTAYRVLANG